jgi:hypothetical protein
MRERLDVERRLADGTPHQRFERVAAEAVGNVGHGAGGEDG